MYEKEELDKYIENIKKFSDKVIFKDVGIEYEVFTTKNVRTDKPLIMIQVAVEPDKMIKSSPQYDENYTEVIMNLDSEIMDINKYFNIPYQQLEPYYYYKNNDFVNKLCEKAQNVWFNILNDEYNFDRQTLESEFFQIYLHENPEYISDTAIYAWCNNIEHTLRFEENIPSCKVLENMVTEIFRKNGLMDGDIDVKIGICEVTDD